MKILEGSYLQYSGNRSGSLPPATLVPNIQSEGSSYEMTDIDDWHKIAPITDHVMSLMITTKPWNRWTRPIGKKLGPLDDIQKAEILDFFRLKYC